MKPFFAILFCILLGLPSTVRAGSDYDYQLYKNHENYGIVVFPKESISKDLDNYLKSIPFEVAEKRRKLLMKAQSKISKQSVSKQRLNLPTRYVLDIYSNQVIVMFISHFAYELSYMAPSSKQNVIN